MASKKVEVLNHPSYSPDLRPCDFFLFPKKVREKSRECHNHKPQPFLDPRGRGNRQIQTSTNRTNVRKALRLALSSPSEVIAILKGLKTQEENDTRKDIQQIAP